MDTTGTHRARSPRAPHGRPLTRAARRGLLCLLLGGACLAAGCDDGGGGVTEIDGEGGAGAADAGPPPKVPYVGGMPDLPDGASDAETFFPVDVGGVWRFREQTDTPLEPPPVSEGAESVILSMGEPDADGEREVVRRTVAIIELEVEGEPTLVRQVMEETFVVRATQDQVGPRIRVRHLKVEERAVADQRFVRLLERQYTPPYTLFEDAWTTGVLGTNLADQVQLIESLTLPGDEEAQERRGNIEATVTTETEPKVLLMEGAYRSDIFEISVFDDFNGALTRTYWVQKGLGPVQWQFQATNNVVYSLTGSNYARDWATEPPLADPEDP